MNSDLCVIMAYCNTDKKVELLKKCIADLKDKNKDIFLTSHYPVPFDIQKTVNYYYYDCNNDVLNYKNNGFVKYNINLWKWEHVNNCKISYIYKHLDSDISIHAYAIWTLIQNAIATIKIKKYKVLHIIDYDVLIGNSDILEEHNKILTEKDCVIYFSNYVHNLFSISNEAADKIFSSYTSINEYFMDYKFDFLFENRFYQLLLKESINCHVFPAEDLCKKTVYLNGNSEIDHGHKTHDLFNNTEYFFFLIIRHLNSEEKYLIIDNKDDIEFDCYITVDEQYKYKYTNINQLRQCIKLNSDKDEYHLKMVVNDTVIFNDLLKVKEHIYYEE